MYQNNIYFKEARDTKAKNKTVYHNVRNTSISSDFTKPVKPE